MSDIEHARAVRRRRSQILRRLRNGDRSLKKTLERPPKAICGMMVGDLIMAAHNMGPNGTDKVLAQANVSPLCSVGNLSTQQRKQLIQHLPKRAT